MLHPLHALFSRPDLPASRQAPRWEESDLKYFVQSYLQDKLKSSQITCEDFRQRKAVVCVGSPALRQAVQLLEFDLIRDLKKQADYSLKELVVRIS